MQINTPGEAVTAQQYFGVGFASGGASDVTDFLFGYRVTDAFSGRNAASLNCNIAQHAFTPASGAIAATCSGATITVGPAPTGNITFTLQSNSALALHINARL